MIRRRSFVASLAATLVAGLLAMVPGTPAVSAATNDKSRRLVKQTETADIYANPDGTNTAVFFAGPTNFFDKATKQWRKIDSQLLQVGGRIENAAGPIQVRLPANMSADDGVTVGKDDDWSASLTFVDATSTRPARINGGIVRYDQVAPGVSLEYRVLSSGLKGDIVLEEALPAIHSGRFRFQLSVSGAAPVAVDGGTAVALQDAQGHEVARIPRGTMTDASGADGVVDMRLSQTGGAWLVDVVPDPAFLRSAERTYPIKIDPSLGSFGSDTYANSLCGSCNYNGATFMKAGRMGTNEYYAYIRFPDVTAIRGKAVTGANLHVVKHYSDDPLTYGLTALRTNGTWNANTLNWSNKAAHGSEQFRYGLNQDIYDFPITSWAQGWANGADGEWINGQWSPFGATINTGGEAGYYELYSYENGVNRPELWITYTNQTPRVPTNVSPADGWTGTPTPPLTATLDDPDDSNGWIEYDLDNAVTAIVPTVNGTASYTPNWGSGSHSWRVRGRDLHIAGPWTALRYLTITPPNSPPTMPDQMSPADGYYDTTLPPLSARFLDNAGNGTLRFEINGVGTFSRTGLANGATGSCTTANLCLPSSLAPGLHSWRVQAVDAFGLASGWSPYQQFEYHRAGQVIREEYPVNGSVWGTKWATSSGLTVSNNQGVFPTVTASKRATATGAYLQDSDVSLTYSIPDRSAGTELRITLRGSGATGSNQLPTGYRLDIPSGSNTVSLKKTVNSTVSTLGSFAYPGPLDASQVRVRFRVDGSQIRVKLWAAGTLEPNSWSLERSDSQITAAGTLQIAQSYQTGTGRAIYIDNVTYQNRSFWGVDSVEGVGQVELNHVLSNPYNSKPVYWGRYLHDDGAPPPDNKHGLTRNVPDEISRLAANKIGIWVIDWNPDQHNLQTEAEGRRAAQRAICHAGPASQACPDGLNIPKTVALFADVEPGLIVDPNWLWGWFDAVNQSGWKVGFYGNPRSDNDFIAPFCTAAGYHPEMLTKSYLWSQQPHLGRTRESTAPTYRAEDFTCDVYGTVPALGWQYGIDRSSPQPSDADLPTPDKVDTDLVKPEMLDVLWYPGGVSCPAPRDAEC